ncbi:hypothetical protein BC830DRAFT_1159017, partial [Chytriomyces sp. MP71]
MILHYCASVFYSLLEVCFFLNFQFIDFVTRLVSQSGKDDAQIAKTHTGDSSLLQFVLKRLLKLKIPEIHSLMYVGFLTAIRHLATVLRFPKRIWLCGDPNDRLRLESVLLNRFARRRMHDSCKRAKALSAAINEQQSKDGAAGSATRILFEPESQSTMSLRDVLQIAEAVDGYMRKAEHNWGVAEKLCGNFFDVFPDATKDIKFVITSYSDYKELSEFGIKCLREFAVRNQLDDFLS